MICLKCRPLDPAELENLPLALWTSPRRKELLELLDCLNPTIKELTAAVEQDVLRLMTHPRVGPLRHWPMCGSSELQSGFHVW